MFGPTCWVTFVTTFTLGQCDGFVSDTCNPYRGVKKIKLGAAGPITAPTCSNSWDLHEVTLFDSSGAKIPVTATTETGTGRPGYGPEKAADGNVTSYWMGDFDVGLSCSCWNDTKKDQQAIDLELDTAQRVAKIEVYQADNEWSILKMNMHCAGLDGIYGSAYLELDTSMYHTVVTCSDSGCDVQRFDSVNTWSCNTTYSSSDTSSTAVAIGTMRLGICFINLLLLFV
eukprot:symbB.v1.2.030330.t1/scaffold3406.1/size57470/2